MIERRGGWRLAAMMALVYAVQGSFWPLLAVHLQDLGLNGRSRGWIFATLAMGSVIVPLRAWVPTAMTLGQWPEIAALAFLPWMLGRIGTKGTLTVGIIAWLVRFLSLLGRPPLAIAVGGGLLHGVGVGCFTVGGQVFLDSRAQTRQRASAQGLFLVLTSGLGSLLGNLMAGDLAGTHPDNDVLVFLIPCVINGAMLIYFLAGFRSHDSTVDRAGASTAELPLRPHSVRGTVGGVGNLVTEPADG